MRLAKIGDIYINPAQVAAVKDGTTEEESVTLVVFPVVDMGGEFRCIGVDGTVDDVVAEINAAMREGDAT